MTTAQPPQVRVASNEQKDSLVPDVYVVKRSRKETHDTFTLEVEPQDQGRNCRFSSGQFNMLYAFGTGESAISISGNPEKTNTFVHTIREVGVVTRALRKLKAGDSIGVRGPFGSSWPIEQSHGQDIVFVVGGIGLAPLRPVLYRVMADRGRFGKVALLYGTRTPHDILFRKELERWSARLDVEVRVIVDLADSDWRGNIGVVTSLIHKTPVDRRDTIAMICGPEIMMRYTVMELYKFGVDYEQMYVSMERNMKCATGFCGHCQFGPTFICKDGPVFPFVRIQHWFGHKEI